MLFLHPAFLEIRQQVDSLAHLGAFSGVGKSLGGKMFPSELAEGRSQLRFAACAGSTAGPGAYVFRQKRTIRGRDLSSF